MQTLLGGEEISLLRLDGESETARVRLVPVREYLRYLELLMDDAALAEFLCEKPKGWADNFSWTELSKILRLGDQLNLDFFGQWLQRRVSLQRHLLPPELAALASPTPSPNAPPISASPSTKPPA